MATIGRLNAFLAADTAAFTTNINKARRDLSSNATRMNRSLVKIDRGFKNAGRSAAVFAKSQLGLRSIIGLVAGTGGLGLLIKRSIDSADKIAKVADATGLTTAALQEFRFAADLSGVATEQFDKALLGFSKRVGEARQGTGSLSEFLRKNNDELLQAVIRSKDTGAALDIVFRSMANLGRQTDRAALAAAAFGRTGVEMTNIVRGGTGALDGMRQRARDLGLVLEDKLLRSTEATSDRLAEFSKQISVNTDRILLTLSPAIVSVTGLFAGLTGGIISTGAALQSTFAPSALHPHCPDDLVI